MAERLTVKIVPSEGGMDALTVESAMQQVLDTFRLLNAADEAIVWRLVSASTNSPFTIVAEAEESVAAVLQMQVFARSLRELQSGIFPHAWRRPELQTPAASFLRRSARELARTEFGIGDEGVPLILSRSEAAPFVENPELSAVAATLSQGATKRQVGSIEGTLIEVTTYRERPAIRISERKTGREITCVMSAELATSVSDKASMQDVWVHRRLTVRGTIYYSAIGGILRVEAASVDAAPLTPESLPPLADPDFTGGLAAAEYLSRFRAGELG
ncbi:MAG TPA: hypothetical protein VIM34_01425 [Burkholderiaceae bacterium]